MFVTRRGFHESVKSPFSVVDQCLTIDLINLADRVGEQIIPVFGDRDSGLPAKSVGRSRCERIDLEGHVRLQFVRRRGFHPGRLDFDHPRSMAWAIDEVVLSAQVDEALIVPLSD